MGAKRVQHGYVTVGLQFYGTGGHRSSRSTMKADNRKAKRRPVHYPAWIQGEGMTMRECHLSDASDSGARLMIASSEELPEVFTLRLSNLGKGARKCRVVWRTKTEAGIEFDKARPAKAAK